MTCSPGVLYEKIHFKQAFLLADRWRIFLGVIQVRCYEMGYILYVVEDKSGREFDRGQLLNPSTLAILLKIFGWIYDILSNNFVIKDDFRKYLK